MLKVTAYHTEGIVADRPALYILHGMFGAGDNWLSIANELGRDGRVYTVDLPGHGDSAGGLPGSEARPFFYPNLATALSEAILATTGREPVTLVGHSMGGKVAMALALAEPALVARLVVVDTAPRSYLGSGFNQEVLEMLAVLDPSKVDSRLSLDGAMKPWISDPVMRGFLLKSLLPRMGGGFRWRFDAAGILAGAADIADWPELGDGPAEAPHQVVPLRQAYPGPCLFIKGALSPYIDEARDIEPIRNLFPQAALSIVEGARHWVHFDKRQEFVTLLQTFLL